MVDLQPMCRTIVTNGKISYQGYLQNTVDKTNYLFDSASQIKTEPVTEFISIATGVGTLEETLEDNLALAPFTVTNAGKLYANEATINGNITANTGKIGNLDISNSGLYLANTNSTSSFGLETNNYQYIKYITNTAATDFPTPTNKKAVSIVTQVTINRKLDLLSIFLGCSKAATINSEASSTVAASNYCMVTIPTNIRANFKLPYTPSGAFVLNSTNTNISEDQTNINNCSQAVLRNLSVDDKFYIIFIISSDSLSETPRPAG